MSETNNIKKVHSGHAAQTLIYLGKLFRMLIFQNDWKVLPMSAVIAGLVSYVVGANLFVTMEGTLLGSFALACICIWNGFFNSIQVICRERPIIKREHRSGMHITSYIGAHMIYQAFLCFCQTLITIGICSLAGVSFPDKSLITSAALVDMGISLFLITYCADMMALMVSAMVHSTTTAMTIMPFLLIFQLVFSGGIFSISGKAQVISNFTIAKWGLTTLCTQGDYNSLPMVSFWNSLVKMKNVEIEGERPLQELLEYAEKTGRKEDIIRIAGENSQNEKYSFEAANVIMCWGFLIMYIILYSGIAVICLEFIDRDRR